VLTAVGYRINRWIRESVLTADLHRANAELARRKVRLQIIANHDQLTGLYNRYYLVDTLEREIHRAKRHQLPLSQAILDIDNFKSHNDTFGHHAGDEVLRAFGSLLNASLRATGIVCRYGGEEFLIVFPDSDGVEALDRIQNVCQDVKQRRYVCRGQESFRVSRCPEAWRNTRATGRAPTS
jgi:diguanylate cyclase (GGDEF)-like protein